MVYSVKAADPVVSGSEFVIYTDTGIAFESDTQGRILEVEILVGTWQGDNCVLGVTDRGGNLYFDNVQNCSFQLTNYHDSSIRLYYEEFGLTTLNQGYSYSGDWIAGTTPFIRWAWGLELPIESDFMFFVGIFGVGLMFGGVLFSAYLVKTTPLFSLGKKEILFEKESFILGLAAAFIGFGFIMVWLLS